MSCKCSTENTWINGDTLTSPFKEMVFIKADPRFLSLRKCIFCDQLWSVDEYEKYHNGICIKINSENEFDNFDDAVYRKERLIQNHGHSEKKCAYKDCNNNALRDLAYCENCALNKAKIDY